ncbi:hypothetical protein HWV62_31571 [Athelia sp. TMB]|nr:hypothetical protein HWV62_31571 [Athelia sp. TMB]
MIRDRLYYWERPMVTFAVENTLFRVPRKQFEQSPVFRDLFSLPLLGSQAEGSSDDRPIHLESINKDEFRSLLMVIYPENSERKRPDSQDEWLSILKLATMWEFDDIKERAIVESTKEMSQKTPLERIALAVKYNVPRWLLDAYTALVQQDNPLTRNEVDALGHETVYQLLQLREQSYREVSRYGNRYGSRNFQGVEGKIVRALYERFTDIGYRESIDTIPEPLN